MPHKHVSLRRQSSVADAAANGDWVDGELVECTFKDERIGKHFRRLLQQMRSLAEADRCKASGQLDAFLRRERLYSSMLASWKKQVGKAELVALTRKKRGPKPNPEARRSNSSTATRSACAANLCSPWPSPFAPPTPPPIVRSCSPASSRCGLDDCRRRPVG